MKNSFGCSTFLERLAKAKRVEKEGDNIQSKDKELSGITEQEIYEIYKQYYESKEQDRGSPPSSRKTQKLKKFQLQENKNRDLAPVSEEAGVDIKKFNLQRPDALQMEEIKFPFEGLKEESAAEEDDSISVIE